MTKDDQKLFDDDLVEEARQRAAESKDLTEDLLLREPSVASMFGAAAAAIANHVLEGISKGEDPKEVVQAGSLVALCHGFSLRDNLEVVRDVRDLERALTPEPPDKDKEDESMDSSRDLHPDGDSPG